MSQLEHVGVDENARYQGDPMQESAGLAASRMIVVVHRLDTEHSGDPPSRHPLRSRGGFMMSWKLVNF